MTRLASIRGYRLSHGPYPCLRRWHANKRFASGLLSGGSTVTLACLLSACMNMSGLEGKAKYACAAPDGVTCQSVSGTYVNAARIGAALTQSVSRPPANVVTSITDTREASDAGTADNDRSTDAWRTRPRVLRLWTKAWEDADGDLWDQGYVYVQITNGAWRIDHIRQLARDRFAPVRPPTAASSPTTPPEPEPRAATIEQADRLDPMDRVDHRGRMDHMDRANRLDLVDRSPLAAPHRAPSPRPAPSTPPLQSPVGRDVPRSH